VRHHPKVISRLAIFQPSDVRRSVS
jgi:hypothetical protein